MDERKSNEDGTEDEVKAHVKQGRPLNDGPESSDDDVEAHVKQGRPMNDDDGDDVEAHVKQGRT
jgi:hypothetical protein